MADGESADRSGRLLPGAHRAVRSLESAEGPFTGVLVTRGDGVAVQVDAAMLAGWVGWSFAGAEHIAGPVDVVRRVGGHDVLLPWCTDQVLGFLVRRAAAGAVLSSGECTTLVVSLLRGLGELGEGAERVRAGAWWLTEGGRPVFVIGEGDDARAGALKIVERLREGNPDKALGRVLASVRQGLRKALEQPRVPSRLLEEWERELLAVAAPRPLERQTTAPRPASVDARPVRPPRGEWSAADTVDRPHRGEARSTGSRLRTRLSAVVTTAQKTVGTLRGRVLQHLDARRSSRRPPAASRAESGTRQARRGRALAMAGAAAAAVLVAGLLWPGGDAGGAADADASRVQVPEEAESEGGSEMRTPNAEAAPAGDADRSAGAESAADGGPEGEGGQTRGPLPEVAGPEAAATALLGVIGECAVADDTVCADAIAAGSTGLVDALAATFDDRAGVELVDEYGDVAVVRVSVGEASPDGGETASGAEHMLVLVRQDEKWLVRDAYDVADQPG